MARLDRAIPIDASYHRSSVMVRIVFELVVDALHSVGLVLRSHTRLAAENLFVANKLALYLERGAKSRRASNSTRLTLVVLARFIEEWRGVLTIVQPDSLGSVAPPRVSAVLALQISGSGTAPHPAGPSN
jgi:hypothetical protein